MKNIVCIIQARTGSTRLPNKILLPLSGKPMLLRVIDRVLESKHINNIVVATTTEPNDEKIVKLLKSYNPKVTVTRGSEKDVLDRYYQAAKESNADIIVRVTSDNPLIDPDIIDKVIEEFLSDSSLNFVSNNIKKHTYPRGLDVEVISFKTLEKLWRTTTESIDREHVTIHIKRFPDKFKWKSVENNEDLSSFRWTVDEKEDYELMKSLYEKLKPGFRMKDVLQILKENPILLTINKNVEHKNPKY